MWFKPLVILIFLLSAPLSLFATENTTQHHQGTSLYESFLSAIEMDSVNEIRQFIAFGADINYRYAGGKTPLMFASSFGNTESIQTLIELGAKIELKSDDGMSAIDFAQKNNQRSALIALQNFTIPKQTQSNRQMITTIQFYLNRLGYIAGDLDGIYGNKTRTSLRQFSKDSKQTFPAEVSERQIEALFNTMSGNDVAELEKPKSIGHVDKETNVDTLPAETEKELVISETNTDR